MRAIFRHFCVCASVLALSACVDQSHQLEGSIGVVEVLETPPPILVVTEPPTSTAVFAGPILNYAEPLPSPTRHTLSVALSPSSMVKLDDVQTVEVDVEIEGGASGDRTINAVFVSPSGVAWERQGTVVAARPGEKSLAHFTLPVASTFIADQKLVGQWQVKTLDDGLEQASATFALEE